ncbi:hypothetical protein O1611_g4590 [Lasiodiplodia mahajangana]|uniref:Uncharacterized protein n=1 Tax=Lasiodiplodia mahajangana TaxID=1108764 RepID=A0ACC2JNM9_9PEZI|nr:hypothetical protein O1611_g4590 [Lasiodiplodia mahajangana]
MVASISYAEGYRLSPCAAVCRQWQQILEKRIFRGLHLHQDDLDDFARIVGSGPRQLYVIELWLDVKLPEYDCSSCQKAESPWESRNNNSIYARAVWRLFEILHHWDPREDAPSIYHLHFYLSAHSPSDGCHHFKEVKARSAETPYVNPIAPKEPAEPEGVSPILGITDMRHGWWNGFVLYSRNTADKQRVMGLCGGLYFDGSELTFEQQQQRFRLPTVRAIQLFSITRQHYRAFRVRQGLGEIFEALPNLKTIQLEPWRGVHLYHHQLLKHQWGMLIWRITNSEFSSAALYEEPGEVDVISAQPRCIRRGFHRDRPVPGTRPSAGYSKPFPTDAGRMFPRRCVGLFPGFHKRPFRAAESDAPILAQAGKASPHIRLSNSSDLCDTYLGGRESSRAHAEASGYGALASRPYGAATWHVYLDETERAAWANVACMHGHNRRSLLVKNIYLGDSSEEYHGYISAMKLLSCQGILNPTSERQLRSEDKWGRIRPF